MRQVGAPTYTTGGAAHSPPRSPRRSPRKTRLDTLKKIKMPNWERYADVDLPTDILDAWDDGEVSPGSTDVSHVSWNVPTMEFGTTCNILGAPGHSWQFVAASRLQHRAQEPHLRREDDGGRSHRPHHQPRAHRSRRRRSKDAASERTSTCPTPSAAHHSNWHAPAAEKLSRKA